MTLKNKKSNTTFGAVILAIIVLTSGFLIQNISIAADKTSPVPQATPVEATIIKPQPVQVWKNFSGHVVAVDWVEIRPQAGGRITELRFEDGQSVKKGDTLIVIDPRPYKAALGQAQAALEAAQTQEEHAAKEYERAYKLIKSQTVSQSLLDDRTNTLEAAKAAVQGSKALVDSAKINLDHAYIKAPISGKISRAEITEGNVVEPGANAPVLTTIVADETVYVDFEIDERTYLNSVIAGKSDGLSNIPVRLKLDNANLEYDGTIHSFDNRIDPATGTIRARAIFNNDDGTLLPGMSVSIQMGSSGDREKILVTERAIGTDQDRKFVYTVNEDNTAQYREIKIGESVDGKRIVLSGLEPGEKVITEGLVRIRPGMPVTPQITNPEETENLIRQIEPSPLPEEDTVQEEE